jgi:hypothetical protein
MSEVEFVYAEGLNSDPDSRALDFACHAATSVGIGQQLTGQYM